MTSMFQNRRELRYWLKVFALYALAEAGIQLTFFFILNTFGTSRISNLNYHFVMWCFQCLLVLPIWWTAYLVRSEKIIIQILVNAGFFVLYSFFWFGPIQDAIGFFHDKLQELTTSESNRIPAYLDRGYDYSFLNYQLLKHGFRLSWFFLAAYFLNYNKEAKKRTELALANRELQLKLLKWHLNPSFYFKTINYLEKVANEMPQKATVPILQLARVMEYVIYEAKEKLIDVRKELDFISNYVDLVNQQSDDKINIALKIEGQYDSLKIAPLLLAAFVDSLMFFNEKHNEKVFHNIHIKFIGERMEFYITNSQNNEYAPSILPGEELQKRISELYAEKYEFTNGEEYFKLTLWLDAK